MAESEALRSVSPGSFVRIELGQPLSTTRWIPADAVVRRGQLTGVFVVDGDELRLRWVRLGQSIDDSVELLAGPGPDALLVRRPDLALVDGQPVANAWGAAPEDISMADWQKVIDLNLNGTFRITQRVGKEMIKQKQGKIINISSYAGLMGTDPDYLNAIPYNASKGGIHAFTKDLATKWAKYNIYVNCMAPGWFFSKMSKWTYDNWREKVFSRLLIKRFGDEDDFKGVVVFLASKASDFMTGQILSVDGGMTTW